MLLNLFKIFVIWISFLFLIHRFLIHEYTRILSVYSYVILSYVYSVLS